MDKVTAKVIKETPDEKLIQFWEKTNDETYSALRKTMSGDRIIKLVKTIADDVINDRPTVFEMCKNGKRYTMIDYLGEK